MATAATKKIANDVLYVLKAGQWEDGGFTIVGELDRTLYLEFIKVMKAYGGAWNRHRKQIVFDDADAEASVQQATATGEYTDLKKLYQFFETPDGVADSMVKILGSPQTTRIADMNLNGDYQLTGDITVLEPSAGHGAIIKALNRAQQAASAGSKLCITTSALELDSAKVKKLELYRDAPGSTLSGRLWTGDFLKQTVTLLGKYDAVVMNPPFSNSQDIDHVRHAINFVKPGGYLVAIMSTGFLFRSDKKAVEFRAWLDARQLDGRAQAVDLPEGTFKSAGTNIRTVMLRIRRET